MRALKGSFVVAIALFIGGFTTSARACDLVGKVVCANSSVPVEGITVILDNGVGDAPSDVTDVNGLFQMHLSGAGGSGEYTVNLTGDVVVCTGYPIDLTATPFEVDAPGCPATPPSAPADCSPGYYKNHPDAWCATCGYGDSTSPACVAEVTNLKTGGSSGAREAAKARIDACFDLLGGASATPCADDDP